MPFASSKPDRLAGRSLSLFDADRAPKGQGRSLRPFSAVRTSAVGNPRVVVVIRNNRLSRICPATDQETLGVGWEASGTRSAGQEGLRS